MPTAPFPPIRATAPHRRAAAGFTLIEIMVALIVIVIGLAAFLPHGAKHATAPGDDAHASQLAAATMGQLLDGPYAAPALAPGIHADDHNPHERIYYVSWSVDDNQPIASCKRITVTVRWPAPNSSSNVRLVAVTPAAK